MKMDFKDIMHTFAVMQFPPPTTAGTRKPKSWFGNSSLILPKFFNEICYNRLIFSNKDKAEESRFESVTFFYIIANSFFFINTTVDVSLWNPGS